MTRISEDYIRALAPDSLRYDVTIEDDFVMSVLPNGIKTWAFIYEYKGRQRRKTLGIHPEMSIDQAFEARRNARQMVARLGTDMDVAGEAGAPPSSDASSRLSDGAARPAVLASGYRRHRTKAQRRARMPARWSKYLAFAGLAALIAMAGFFALTRFGPDDSPGDVPAAGSETPAQKAPAGRASGRPRATPATDEGAQPAAPRTPRATGSVSNPFSLSNQRQNSAPEAEEPVTNGAEQEPTPQEPDPPQ